MSGLARLASGRRSKWFVILGWLVVLVLIGFQFGSKLGDVTDDRQQSSLPKEAESTRVLELENSEFKGSQTSTVLIVYQRAGRLTAQDKAKIAADARKIAADKDVKLVGRPIL